MATSSERIFIIGGTGTIGRVTVKDLLKSGTPVTVYARSTTKAQELLGNDANLTIVQGDFEDLKPFEGSIAGHTRLLLVGILLAPNFSELKRAIAQIAYAAGVKQIVDISASHAGFGWRTSEVVARSRDAEEAVLSVPNRGTYVSLRPHWFMSNHLNEEARTIKTSNAIFGIAEPGELQPWISTNDIGILASNIFQEPIEKHGDAVYEMCGDLVSREDHASLLTKVLGRPIKYVKLSFEEMYTFATQQLGMPHLLAYGFLETPSSHDKITPGLSILLGRPPQTLEQWLEENKADILKLI